MKKIFKNPIFTFILGAVLFSGITGVVAATMLAKDVSYTPKDSTWKVDNVKEAIDDLYTKAKPEYTGSTTVTPTTSNQTLSTKNTILTKNITINAIPDTYKNLTTTTTVSASNLLSGVKAYTSDGTLVTGNISTNCISNNNYIIEQSCTTSSGCKILDFEPSLFILYTGTSSSFNASAIYYYNSNVSSTDFITAYDDGSDGIFRSGSVNNRFTFNNGFYLHNLGTSYAGKTVYYMACK